MSSLREQLAASSTVAREKPRDANEAARLDAFINQHPELLRVYDEVPPPEHRRRWMLRQMRLQEAYARQRVALGQTLEHFPDLKQKLELRQTIARRQRPGDVGPKFSP